MRLTALLMALLVTLTVLELGVRIVSPVPLHATDTYLVPPRTFQSGAMVLVPGASFREKTGEWDIRIRINSHGLRDREIPYEKTSGAYRILVLGDSQTFGQGVEAEETYAKVLERELARQSGRPVETVNTGVPGTGTVHQLWFLEEQGWRYRPDAVVVGFYFNDITDNAQCHLYGLKGGRLVRTASASERQTPAHTVTPAIPAQDFRAVHEIRAPPPPPVPSPLIRHSHLARLVRRALSRIKQSGTKPVEVTRPARQMTTELFGEIARQCRERGVPCVIALIPSKEQKAGGDVKTLRETWAPFLTQAEAAGAQVVDLWPAFERGGFPRLFLKTDPHLAAPGHQLIGETLADQFQKLRKPAEPR